VPDLPDLRAAAGAALVEVTTSEVPDDWDERWKAFHQPVQIGRAARTPAVDDARPGLLDVVIDPAQAFGTGPHPTTRLCLELLLELEPGGAVVDVGCGSGVLAIAAARLGWGPVLGVDHERDVGPGHARQRRRQRRGRARARRHDLLRDGTRPGRARRSWPTCCARCCCASRRTASPARSPTP
jgi:ribosomal protein L11 methyltransferase